MISNIFINRINGVPAGFGLTKGTNLFAEVSQGDKYVIVTTTDIRPEENTIPDIYNARLSIRCAGWGMAEGELLLTNICKSIVGMEGGAFTFVNSASKTETYKILSLSVINWPTLFYPEMAGYSSIIEVAYRATTT